MGNISYVSSKKNITVQDVLDICERVNREQLASAFVVEAHDDCVTVAVVGDEYPSWVFWIEDSKRKISGKHPRPGWDWMYWAWDEMQNACARAWSGRLSDEGCGGDGTWAPEEPRSFFSWLCRHYQHMPLDTREPYIEMSMGRLHETAPASLHRLCFSSKVVAR